jgi:hypothetical protein
MKSIKNKSSKMKKIILRSFAIPFAGINWIEINSVGSKY